MEKKNARVNTGQTDTGRINAGRTGDRRAVASDIYRLLFDISKDIIYTLDPFMGITSVNQSFCLATGHNAAEIIGKSVETVPELKIIKETWPDIVRHIINGTCSREYETQVRLKDKSRHLYKVSLTPVLGRDGNVTGIVGTHRDITGVKDSEQEIRRLSRKDALTGLPNRLALEERIGGLISLGSSSGHKFGVIYLDLDNFKKVNDTLGHSIGDELLKEVGSRLDSGVRKYDTLARIGGDEFAIVLLDVKKNGNLAKFCNRLLRLFEIPFLIRGNTIYISPSIGISVYPDDGCDVGELLQNVDTAMYKAKGNGKNNYQFYDISLKEELTRKVSIEKFLRRALRKSEFCLNYQPLISTGSGSIRAFEALLRWKCEELGSVSPCEFIPVAEECGLIAPIEEWVLKTACLKKKEWELNYGSKALISVNISALHFKQADFVCKVRDILAQTGLEPGYLELEITESVLINQLDDVVRKLGELRKMGIRISLDDFGTGYSSLNYLRTLPIDTLKIDKTFIHGIGEKTNDKHFVKSLVSLMRKYALDIVAEGVETAEQFHYLSKCRCSFVQGFLLGRPVAEEAFTGMLSDGKIDVRGIN